MCMDLKLDTLLSRKEKLGTTSIFKAFSLEERILNPLYLRQLRLSILLYRNLSLPLFMLNSKCCYRKKQVPPNTNPSRQAAQQTSWREYLGKPIFRRPSVHMPKKESKSKGTLVNYKSPVLSNMFTASIH